MHWMFGWLGWMGDGAGQEASYILLIYDNKNEHVCRAPITTTVGTSPLRCLVSHTAAGVCCVTVST